MSRSSRLTNHVQSALEKLGLVGELRTSTKSYSAGSVVESNITITAIQCSPPQSIEAYQDSRPIDRSKIIVEATDEIPRVGDRLTLGEMVWIITAVLDMTVNQSVVARELTVRQENQV